MHLAAVLNAPLQGWESDVAFAAFAASRGLSLDPLSTHAGSAEGRQGFLLGYAAWDEESLAAGVETLAGLLAEGHEPAAIRPL